jgi:hypothetical protein
MVRAQGKLSATLSHFLLEILKLFFIIISQRLIILEVLIRIHHVLFPDLHLSFAAYFHLLKYHLLRTYIGALIKLFICTLFHDKFHLVLDLIGTIMLFLPNVLDFDICIHLGWSPFEWFHLR